MSNLGTRIEVEPFQGSGDERLIETIGEIIAQPLKYPVGYLLIWQPGNQQGELNTNPPTPVPLWPLDLADQDSCPGFFPPPTYFEFPFGLYYNASLIVHNTDF